MQFDGALSTAEPQCKALGILLDAGENTILWDDCRLIWDSASLVSSGTKSDEVFVFGAEGKYSKRSGEVYTFKFKHCFEFGPDKKYVIRVSKSSLDGQEQLVDVVYQTRYSDGGQRLFEQEVHEMTDAMKSGGLQEALTTILKPTVPSTQPASRSTRTTHGRRA